MEWSSWFRRSLSSSKTSKPTKQNESTHSNQAPHQVNEPTHKTKPHQENQEEILGVTQELIQHVKSFTVETFKNFPLPDEGSTGATYDDEAQASRKTTASGIVRKDLSEWQEKHAVLVLSKVKELSQLRFKLCPRHLKEQEFWRVYFSLVKSYVAEYELQAIRLAKLKSMAMENEKMPDGSAIEVEMAETKPSASLTPSTP